MQSFKRFAIVIAESLSNELEIRASVFDSGKLRDTLAGRIDEFIGRGLTDPIVDIDLRVIRLGVVGVRSRG